MRVRKGRFDGTCLDSVYLIVQVEELFGVAVVSNGVSYKLVRS